MEHKQKLTPRVRDAFLEARGSGVVVDQSGTALSSLPEPDELMPRFSSRVVTMLARAWSRFHRITPFSWAIATTLWRRRLVFRLDSIFD